MAGNFFDDPVDAPAGAQSAPAQGAPAPQALPPKIVPPDQAAAAINNAGTPDSITPRPKPQPNPRLKGNFFGDEDDAVAPQQAAKATPDGVRPDFGFWRGLAGEGHNFLTFLSKVAGRTSSVIATAEDTDNTDPNAMNERYQAWANEFVHPLVQQQAKYDLPPDATVSEQIRYGLGSMAGMIGEAYLTGGASLSESVTARVGERLGAGTLLRRWAANAAGGAAFMQPAAIEHATQVGDQVLDSTGDTKAAAIAAATAYGSTTLLGALPFGARGGLTGLKGLAVGGASAFAAGAGGEEAQRLAENAGNPDALHQDFSMERMLVAGAVATPMALLGGGHPGERPAVEVKPDIIQEAELLAADTKRVQGGDNLDQALASIEASVHVAGAHDNAAVEGARHAEAQAHAETLQAHQEQEARDQAFAQAEAEKGVTPAQEALAKENAFQQADADNQNEKDQDFSAAKNQVGEQEVESSKTAESGAEKGGGAEPKPTVADSLTPDQQQAFQSLKERRVAEAAKSAKAQASDAEDAFIPLAPGAQGEPAAKSTPPNRLAAIRAAAEKRAANPAEPAKPAETKASATDEDELPQRGPKAPTPKSLADVRQADLDRKMAAKIRQPSENGAPVLRKTTDGVTERPVPAREERQFVARNADTGEEVARFNDFEAAKAHKDAFPNDDITHETRAAVEGRTGNVAGEAPTLPPTEREELPESPAPTNLADRRQARQTKQAQRRVQFADATARIRPQDVIYAHENGEHTAVTPGGRTHAVDTADNNLRITRDDTEKSARGQGEATARAERLAQEVHARGGQLTSDASVSPEHERVWDALARRGYDVQRNPNAARNPATGNLVSDHPNNPIFTAGAKRDPATETGFALRRRAEAGDQSAHEELARRASTANEPQAPEQGALASKRDAAQARDNVLAPRRGADTGEVSAGASPNESKVPAAAQKLLQKLHPAVADQFHFHDDATTLPQDLQDDARLKNMYGPNGELPRGAYDPATKRAHIIGAAHLDESEVQRVMAHELTHLGNHAVLGDKYDSTMQSIHDHLHNKETDIPSADTSKADKVKAREWMADYAEQHSLNLKDAAIQKHVADEYTAHLAEQDASNPSYKPPGVLRYLYSQMRAAFRKMGLNIDWTDNDLRALRQRIASHLGDFRTDIAEREAQGAPRWMAARSTLEPGLPPTGPESIAAKFGRTMEEQADSGPSTLKSRFDWLRSGLMKGNAISMRPRLAFLHLDSLPDIVRAMKTPREFVRTVQQMTGRQGRLMDQGGALALQWSRWANGGIFKDPNSKRNFSLTTRKGQVDGGKSLHDLMHSTTIAGVDPSREYQPAFEGERTPEQQQLETRRKAFYKQAQDSYNKLDPEGREIYNKVRDYYQDRRQDVMNGLEQRIAETGADAKTKQELMAELRKTFEGGRVKGPYFPLARFGDHWAMGKDPTTGEYAFSRFEDLMQRKRWLERAQAAGLDTKQGTIISDRSVMERINPEFVKKVMSATEGNKELQDEIWTHYLKSMPEMSMRKNLLHRKNILGYSEDALRAFAYNAFHSAHQIARLEYGNRLDAVTDRMEQEANDISDTQRDSSNATWAPNVAAEFRRRLDWIKNPRASAWSSAATKAGFSWYIGASPATAVRISTQNAMLAEPYLGAKASKWGLNYNAGRRELWKAVGEWSKTSMNPFGKSNLGDSLRGNERDMFDELRARGTFSSTSAQMLASGGADRPIGVGKMDAFNRVSSFMFNAMEHKNRMTTALAAYRLAIRGGLSHTDAIEEANDASNKAHFNYNNYNRPRVLQNDFMKVAGLFKQYPWQVTDRLARSFRDGLMPGREGSPFKFGNKELSPDERAEAMKAFAGYMGKMMLFAGIKGVPILYHATMAAINNVFGDKDQPFDAQAALREQMEQHIGKTASDAVMDGPMSALTGAALSNGASYADLWYKQPEHDMSFRDTATDFLAQLAGPVYGSLPEFGVGADMIHNGNIERGLEHMTPPAVNHLMKASRAAQEGYTNLRGEQVVSPDELGEGWSTGLVGLGTVRQKNLLLQALGFTPQVVARQYEQNTSEQNFKEEIEKRQQFLTEQYDNAVSRGDNDGAIKWMQQMQQFHQANPSIPWSAKGMINSIRSNEKNAATADHGVNMTPGMANEYQQMTGAQP